MLAKKKEFLSRITTLKSYFADKYQFNFLVRNLKICCAWEGETVLINTTFQCSCCFKISLNIQINCVFFKYIGWLLVVNDQNLEVEVYVDRSDNFFSHISVVWMFWYKFLQSSRNLFVPNDGCKLGLAIPVSGSRNSRDIGNLFPFSREINSRDFCMPYCKYNKNPNHYTPWPNSRISIKAL